jgi:hypothetical protein
MTHSIQRSFCNHMPLSDILTISQYNDMLHPLIAGKSGNINGNNDFSYFKMFRSVAGFQHNYMAQNCEMTHFLRKY